MMIIYILSLFDFFFFFLQCQTKQQLVAVHVGQMVTRISCKVDQILSLTYIPYQR